MSENLAYGRGFALWRAAATAAEDAPWPAYVEHAFVRGLGDGTLPEGAFLHYLVQDYIFLKHFSRAWGLAIAKADNLAEMTACAETVVALLTHEMRLHEQVCAAAGIELATLQSAREEPENLAYTRYVLEAGYSGDFLTLLAALAPCVLGYGAIGAALKNSAVSTCYGDWIDTYSGAEYQGVCADVGALIDGALVARYGANFADLPVWQSLTQTFITATRLEVGFWDMGLRGA